MARAKSDLVCTWGFSINSCRGFVHCNFAVVILGISVKISMEAMETNRVIVIFHLVLE